MAEIKFCGLTRPEDAEFAGSLGADYLGVIFAGGPRSIDPVRAAIVLDACGTEALRVGVFGRVTAAEVARIALTARLDVVQLHGDPGPDDVAEVRGETGALVWAVVRVTDRLPFRADELFETADALLLDAHVDAGALGGRGVAFDWAALCRELEGRRAGRVVLAGGLRAENVGVAVATLQPDVVDVSSGVESAPGIKDHARMRAFAAAVAGAGREKP